MPIDSRNGNTLWASTLVETLVRLGLKTAVVCPGSRSGPLATAFALNDHVNAIPVLDERSAAFFALGHARITGVPVALVCTSGTAGANFFPAIIEAHESHVPLLVFTADRPPELRHCHAGQAIDQVRLYGHYPNWQTELALPQLDLRFLAYLRQTLIHGWERSLMPTPGPVHFNCPFRDPLAPIPDLEAQSFAQSWNQAAFFADIAAVPMPSLVVSGDRLPLPRWQDCDRGLIIAGPAQPHQPANYCQAIADLSQYLGWPVLAEGLSPLRNYQHLNPNLISTYAIALRSSDIAQRLLMPHQIIRIGELPTSKDLRQWLALSPNPQWVVESSDHNVDPLHGNVTHLRTTLLSIQNHLKNVSQIGNTVYEPSASQQGYLQEWLFLEKKLRTKIDQTLSQTRAFWESKVAWMLARHLPPQTSLFIGNSMPVRDVEFLWPLNQSQIRPFFNRGTNGIDGTLSTAMGMTFHQQPGVLLTGDLSFLHDTNGLLNYQHWQGHLTVLLLNNCGGGIFGMLPIAKYDPPFEKFFATPQQVDFSALCRAYGVEHQSIDSWEQLGELLNPLPESGMRVLEVRCDRTHDVKLRQHYFSEWLNC